MSTLSSCRRAIGMSALGALFALGCGEQGTAPPAQEEGPSLLAAASAPDIIVTTTLDVSDFGGGQVSDLPGPDGLVSLREAITAANNTSGPQGIGFNIPASDPGFDGTVFTIRPLSGLPDLTGGATTIDGATQTSFTGNTNPAGPEVVINGTLLSAPAGGNGLTIRSANNRVRSLVINGFRSEGCCEGGHGILIDGVAATGNVITGCYLGTNATGSLAIPNDMTGVSISGSATSNRVGGTSPADRNVISGNTGAGMSITAEANLVQGNFIGTDRTGSFAIGGGAGGGVAVDIAGDNNTIGGPSSGARNIISGNGGAGVSINGTGRPLGNTVRGNFIGTDVTGTVGLGNGGGGVSIVSDLFEPGGPRPANNNRVIENLVSANVGSGIGAGSDNNELIGNLIGTDVTGMTALGNEEDGISIGGAENRVLHNLVSANGRTGIILFGVDNTVIRGNRIGTNINGEVVAGFGNAEYGVSVGSGASPTSDGNQIGGGGSNQGNIIAGNQANGVLIQAGVQNSILHNRIFSNGAEGIDLGQDGVTPNDPGDADVGANNLMNFPVLISAKATPGRLIVKGTIDTPNPKSVTLEFFANPVPLPGGDPSGHGEGAVFLGTDRPNAQGKFTATLPTVTAGTLISATATDGVGNTSEFSANIAAE